jgi:capsular exopolysaccharide synthesis family protein
VVAVQDNNLAIAAGEQHSSLIDFKRITYRALRYWYLVVISLTGALALAFYTNRYTQRVYSVSASIIIREKEETTGGELLYKNALVDQYRNYLNELYIIKSYPLIQRVVEDLNFGVTIYQEGYILTTEVYKSLPFNIRLLKRNEFAKGPYILKILDDKSFSLNFKESSEPDKVFNVGDTIRFDENSIVTEYAPDNHFAGTFNTPYILFFRRPLDVAGEYVGKIGADWAEEGAGVINLRLNGTNPPKEIDFLRGLIVNYQLYDLEKKNQTADRTIAFIKNELVTISDSLRLFEGQLQQFKKSNRTSGNFSAEAERVFARLETLEIQKSELIVQKNYYDYLQKYINENRSMDQVLVPASFGIKDPILTSLVTKIIDLQMEVKLYLDREKSMNPLVSSRQEKIKELKREILESIKGLHATGKIQTDYLDKQIRDIEKQIGNLPLAERQLISIQRNYSLLENLYLFLMQKMSEAEISKASNTTDIVLVNPPMQAGGAIAPNVNQNYMLAVLGGLAVPTLIFILLELVNTRVQSREDIEKLTKIPFIGGIGHKKGDFNLEVLRSPKSSISESFRALRSDLNYFTGKNEKLTFLITSSISGEGKSFTSINLASVFSLSGKKTLIIGADMRKPKLYMDFKLSNETGLSSYLAGISTFADVVQKTEFAQLDLVSGGPVPPNPSELLLTDRMSEFMKEAKSKYDYIIIDSPPMAIVTDAFVLSPYVDHTIFLIRQNYTPKILLRNSQDYYASGKIKNVSIVFNDVYKSGPGYGYGYGHGYGYSYGYGYGYYGKRKNGYGYYSES